MSRPAGFVAAAVAGLVVLAGCTGGSGDPGPTPGGAGTGGGPSASSTPSQPVGDVTPEELSQQVLGRAAEDADPLGSTTGPVVNGQETTLDVLDVHAFEGGTSVRFRLTAAAPYQLGLVTFSDARFGTVEFVRDVHLDDPASGTRLLPLQFEDYRAACVCPYKPLELGPEPSVLTAVFPPLPEGADRVDVGLGGDSPLTVTDVPAG